jgi:hypothetical protein
VPDESRLIGYPLLSKLKISAPIDALVYSCSPRSELVKSSNAKPFPFRNNLTSDFQFTVTAAIEAAESLFRGIVQNKLCEILLRRRYQSHA